MLKNIETTPQIIELNEMMLSTRESLPVEIENSIYYPKLKMLLHNEIYTFCKEQIELKADLNFLRMNVGQVMSEGEIREYLDGLKLKYNNKENNLVCLSYHIEATRIDFGVPVFVVIRRGNDILMKKFVFRFRKGDMAKNVNPMSTIGIPLEALKNNNKEA